MQTFVCLESPLSEDYANGMVTIGKPEYPIRYTIQSLVDDSLHALVFGEMVGEKSADDGRVKSCGCFVFIPSPPIIPALKRCIRVDLVGSPVLESVAFASQDLSMIDEGSPDYHLPDDDTGLLPMIPLPHEKCLLNVTLVISDDDASVVVGVRLSSPIDNILAPHWLHCKLKLQAYPLSKVKAKCYQLSGHLFNNGKQINILTGQGSCSVE